MLNLSTGPTALSTTVYQAINKEIISHRSEEFSLIKNRIEKNLMRLAYSNTEPVIITTSGTGAIDSVFCTLLNNNKKILIVSCGFYGDLAYKIAVSYIANVYYLRFENGKGIREDIVNNYINKHGDFDYIYFTHNESSTGVMNDIYNISNYIKKISSAKIIVDCISSFGSCSIKFDNLPIDIMIASTQKGLMSLPGIAILFIKDSIKSHILSIQNSRGYYLNLKNYIDSSLLPIVPFTPAIMAYYSLEISLKSILEEGIENIEKRQKNMAIICQKICENLGFSLLAEKDFRSLTVTAFFHKDITDLKQVFNMLLDKNISISQGNGNIKDSLLRVGHMGNVRDTDLFSFEKIFKEIVRDTKK